MAFTSIDMSDCFLSSANTEQRFIDEIAELVSRQIAGGGGGSGKCMWKQVWEEHGTHFRLREQQVPKHTGVRKNRLGPSDIAGVCGRMRKPRGEIRQQSWSLCDVLKNWHFIFRIMENYKWKTC